MHLRRRRVRYAGRRPGRVLTGAVFTTARLLAREFRPGDADAAFAMWSDPEVVRYAGAEVATGIDVIRTDIPRWQRVSAAGPGFGFWALETADAVFVGDVFVRPFADFPDEAELGWHVARPLWGQGYATEATRAAVAHAHAAGVRRLVALVDPANVTSLRVAEKAGLRHEGESDRYDPDDGPLSVWSSEAPPQRGAAAV